MKQRLHTTLNLFSSFRVQADGASDYADATRQKRAQRASLAPCDPLPHRQLRRQPISLFQIFLLGDPAFSLPVSSAEQIGDLLDRFRTYADLACTEPDALARAAIFDAAECGLDNLDRRRRDVQRTGMIFHTIHNCGACPEALKREIVDGDVAFDLRPDRRTGVVIVARARIRRPNDLLARASDPTSRWTQYRRLEDGGPVQAHDGAPSR